MDGWTDASKNLQKVKELKWSSLLPVYKLSGNSIDQVHGHITLM